jgi:L-alanine-DL-glutamate epimerase-like enolase superfamily enzyme
LTAVPHGTYVECFADPERDPVWQSMWVNRPPIADGTIELPPGPGFGLELDQAMIDKYRVA